MKQNIFIVVVNGLLFWVVTDLFEGIDVTGGLVSYLFLGAVFGLAMLLVRPLIKFFTLPHKQLYIVLGSVMLGIIVFLIMNFGIPGIDFKEGDFSGINSSYVQINQIKLSMVGNIILGGAIAGVLSSLLDWLYD